MWLQTATWATGTREYPSATRGSTSQTANQRGRQRGMRGETQRFGKTKTGKGERNQWTEKTNGGREAKLFGKSQVS